MKANTYLISAIGTVILLSGVGAQANEGPNLAQTIAPNSELEGQAKKVRFKENTTVNFGDTVVKGQARNPFFSLVPTRDTNSNGGFIRIRYNWHDQQIMSVSGLSQ